MNKLSVKRSPAKFGWWVMLGDVFLENLATRDLAKERVQSLSRQFGLEVECSG